MGSCVTETYGVLKILEILLSPDALREMPKITAHVERGVDGLNCISDCSHHEMVEVKAFLAASFSSVISLPI